MNNKAKFVLFLIGIIAIIAIFFMVFDIGRIRVDNPVAFFDCIEKGGTVRESYPRICVLNELSFIENIGNENNKIDLIRNTYPRPSDFIASPLKINGVARGNWYFEATFPIKLKDDNGKVIAEYFATANSDWMTTDFVPYTAELEFDINDVGDTGTLVLEKSNPSGDPIRGDSLIIPIRFLKHLSDNVLSQNATSTIEIDIATSTATTSLNN